MLTNVFVWIKMSGFFEIQTSIYSFFSFNTKLLNIQQENVEDQTEFMMLEVISLIVADIEGSFAIISSIFLMEVSTVE